MQLLFARTAHGGHHHAKKVVKTSFFGTSRTSTLLPNQTCLHGEMTLTLSSFSTFERSPATSSTSYTSRAHSFKSSQTSSQSTIPIQANLHEPSIKDSSIQETIFTTTRPNFESPESAHGNKSIPELLRSLSVFQLCKIPFLVQHADNLIHYSRNIFGNTITDTIIKNTFFHQFCAGTNDVDIQPTIQKLKSFGIGAILDYAAEEDVMMNSTQSTRASPSLTNDEKIILTHPPYNQPARIYEYQSEKKCDHHVDIFIKCIDAVRKCSTDTSSNATISSISSSKHHNIESSGFAAIKVTALGNPLLLERMSNAINEANKLFAKFDLNQDGLVTRDEFQTAYQLFFNNGDDILPSLLDELDPNYTNQIDYITVMSKLLSPMNLPHITTNCKNIGPLAMATPSTEEIDLMHLMHDRAHKIAKSAFDNQVRLLIDAEQTKYQPAIDNLTLELQQTYNQKDETNVPIIFNTYQCYLKDSIHRITIDLERSKRYDYHFGAKLVRGAYMVSERSRAKEMNYCSPIHPTVHDTHKCYNDAIEMLLRKKVNDTKLKTLEIMCATHNQESIEKALELMEELKLNNYNDLDQVNELVPSSSDVYVSSATAPAVHFAQLYGMSDNLTFPLAEHKYHAFKYVPYGQVHEVMPYLLRRAQENSDVLGNASKELSLVFRELKNRFVKNLG